MDIKPGNKVNKDRFSAPKDSLEVMYGLPREVTFCSKCNISNQQPMSTNEQCIAIVRTVLYLVGFTDLLIIGR